MRTQRLDLKLIMENCRFFLVRNTSTLTGLEEKLANHSSESYKLSDFEKLRLVKVIRLPEVERDVGQFMAKNNMELEFSSDNQHLDDQGMVMSSDHEHLRMTSFLLFTLEHADGDVLLEDFESRKV
jgi:hypothetical protein